VFPIMYETSLKFTVASRLPIDCTEKFWPAFVPEMP
jgi:hypothetical protein